LLLEPVPMTNRDGARHNESEALHMVFLTV